MQSSSTPEAAAAAVARRKQLIQQQIAQTEADAAAATASTSQASGSRGPGRFTPKPTAQIFRQSVSGADSPSMDYEYENEVEMYGGDMRRSSPPPRPRTPEKSALGVQMTGLTGLIFNKRGQRAQPLFADHTQHRNPESSRASTAQVEEMLTRPTNGEPSASRQDNTTRPPLMTAPGAPKTPSSTGKTTETHIMNLQSLIEHLNLLERRRAAAEKQSEFRQNRITSLDQENKELDQENKELNLKLETTRLEVLEWRNKSDEKQDRITELTLEVRRLKGKGPAV
ncbi:hypothetical protein FRB90_000938 [Tulasnella sp. 427]|nr:hypothetical protein FRB90_000938 [Tulasnella sp. 427]